MCLDLPGSPFSPDGPFSVPLPDLLPDDVLLPVPNQENLELLLLVEPPELEDASEPEELLGFVRDFSEPSPVLPRFDPVEPPYELVVEPFPVSPGLLKPDPLELLLGFDPKIDRRPPFDPGLLLLDAAELLDPPE